MKATTAIIITTAMLSSNSALADIQTICVRVENVVVCQTEIIVPKPEPYIETENMKGILDHVRRLKEGGEKEQEN